MYIFLTIALCVVAYIAIAGVTHGYAKHRWPPKVVRRQVYVDYRWEWQDQDDNSAKRNVSTCLWPFYWLFIWPFTKSNEITFSRIEKAAALEIVRKKERIEILRATKAELEAASAELKNAEVEVEKEMANL